MKYLLALSLLFSQAAHAGMTDSLWFEPTLACSVVGVASYQSAPKGQELNSGAIGCAAGALAFYLINSYYDNKIAKRKDAEIKNLEQQIKLMNDMQAQRVLKGDPSVEFSLKVRECTGAQELPNGSIQSPVCTDSLVVPKTMPEVGY